MPIYIIKQFAFSVDKLRGGPDDMPSWGFKYLQQGYRILGRIPCWSLAGLTSIVPVLALVCRARMKSLRPNQCPQCRYDLTGNTSGVCPECGREIVAVQSKEPQTPIELRIE